MSKLLGKFGDYGGLVIMGLVFLSYWPLCYVIAWLGELDSWIAIALMWPAAFLPWLWVCLLKDKGDK